MKTLLLVVTITATLSLVNKVSAATDGTVNFSGKLSDQTCQVTLNDGTSASGTVKLPTVPKSSLDTKPGRTPFTLKLTNCQASATAFGVTAYFPPNAANIYDRKLINKETGANAASGVSLEIGQNINGVDKIINLGWELSQNKEFYTTVNANTTSATMKYFTHYVKNGDPVKAGKVTGVAVYELAYQ